MRKNKLPRWKSGWLCISVLANLYLLTWWLCAREIMRIYHRGPGNLATLHKNGCGILLFIFLKDLINNQVVLHYLYSNTEIIAIWNFTLSHVTVPILDAKKTAFTIHRTLCQTTGEYSKSWVYLESESGNFTGWLHPYPDLSAIHNHKQFYGMT